MDRNQTGSARLFHLRLFSLPVPASARYKAICQTRSRKPCRPASHCTTLALRFQISGSPWLFIRKPWAFE